MSKNQERTFIAVKPDGVQRGFVGKIIGRFEDKGFKLVALKMLTADNNLLATHYGEHVKKPFYDGLLKYMASGPVVAMVWEGKGVVKTGRLMLGETDPADSKPGTIRADYCIGIRKSIIHGSDSIKSAQREIALWFQQSELNELTSCHSNWLYE